jgi:hypothetical protein
LGQRGHGDRTRQHEPNYSGKSYKQMACMSHDELPIDHNGPAITGPGGFGMT